MRRQLGVAHVAATQHFAFPTHYFGASLYARGGSSKNDSLSVSCIDRQPCPARSCFGTAQTWNRYHLGATLDGRFAFHDRNTRLARPNPGRSGMAHKSRNRVGGVKVPFRTINIVAGVPRSLYDSWVAEGGAYPAWGNRPWRNPDHRWAIRRVPWQLHLCSCRLPTPPLCGGVCVCGQPVLLPCL